MPSSSPSLKRILQESRELSLNPDPSLSASPLESNLYEWHFTLSGPPSTPYDQGIYHGRIILPPTYPLRPPSFRFLTPSGRFETNREICLSISGHHEESWQPAWGIRTALCAIRAFMAGEAKGQVGGLEMGQEGRARLAKESRTWKCAACGGRSNEEILKEVKTEAEGREAPAELKHEVPEGLGVAYRDEMDRKNVKPTVTGPSTSSIQSTAPSSTSTVAVEPRPPLDAALVTDTSTSHNAAIPTTTTRPHSSLRADGVPAWVDKAIVGVAVGLIVMVVKKIII